MIDELSGDLEITRCSTCRRSFIQMDESTVCGTCIKLNKKPIEEPPTVLGGVGK